MKKGLSDFLSQIKKIIAVHKDGTVKRTSLKSGFFGGLIIGLILMSLYYVNFFEKLEAIAIDMRFQIRQNPPLSKDLVIVGVSKTCIDRIGGYPIPRDKYAKTIDFISKSGAKSICFDIFFDLPGTDRENDESLASAFENADNVTLPVFTPYKIQKNRSGRLKSISIRENLKSFTEASERSGHINIIPGSDGKIRQIPTFFISQNKYIFSMSLVAYMEFKDISHKEIKFNGNRLNIRDISIPMDKYNYLMVNYFNPENAVDFLHLELPGSEFNSGINFFYFNDIITGKVPSRFFKDKLVLIGQTSHGLSNSDEYITPFGVMYGAFIQASLINSFLEGHFIKRLEEYQNMLIILILSILLGCLFTRLSLNKSSLFCILLIFLTLYESLIIFNKHGIIIEIIPILGSIFLIFSVHLIKRIKEAFQLIMEKEVELNVITKSGEKFLDLYDVSNTPNMLIRNVEESIPVEICIIYTHKKENEQIIMQFTDIIFNPISSGTNLKNDILEIMEYFKIKVQKNKQPILMNNFNASFENKDISENIKSLLIVPLIVHRDIIGIVCLSNKLNPLRTKVTNFSNEDLKLLKSLIPQSAISLENYIIYNNIQSLFMNIIKSLIASIDAKDQYTAGHSERVTSIAQLIGNEMNLNHKDKTDLKIGAILHDIGKIGISEQILCSKNKLTNEEFEVIKSHPIKGEEILKHIEEFRQIIPCVKYHHERFDGRGYPEGLVGEKIPLLARIIAVADTFDAITSNRTYRNKRDLDFAIEEIERCSSTQFDPKIVEAFLNCYHKNKHNPEGPFWEEEIVQKNN